MQQVASGKFALRSDPAMFTDYAKKASVTMLKTKADVNTIRKKRANVSCLEDL